MTKKCTFALAIFMNALLFSCHEKAVEVTVTRIIKNASDVDLSIEVYFRGDLVDSLSIDASKADTTVAQCWTWVYGGLEPACSLFSWGDADSVLVTFTDSKFLRYCRKFVSLKEECNVNGKNIMILPNTHHGYDTQPGPGRVYPFEITKDDYNVAISIE